MGRIEYLHKLLMKREISSRELTLKYLDAIERDNPSLGAFVNVTREEALSAADAADRKFRNKECTSILEGIPTALKDNISTKGIETTCCSKMLSGYKPIYDATVWSRLKKSGAVLLGKTNMDEFAMGSSTENSCFYPAHNPYDTSCSAGGSSGGSAAAVAANLIPYALGSDTGGSIRQPAAFCGIAGLKPTYGTVSRSGLIAFASGLDQIGPMASTIEDVSVVFDAIAGHDALDSTSAKDYVPETFNSLKKDIKGKTIGVVEEFTHGISEDVVKVFEKTLRNFRMMGVNVECFSMPEIDYALPAYYILACAEASSNLARYDGIRYGHKTEEIYESISEMMRKSRSEGFSEEIRRRILLGTYVLSHGYYDAYYKKAQSYRAGLTKAFDNVFRKCDAIITPTSPTTAFKLQRVLDSPVEAYMADVCTVPVNIAALPAVSFCAGYGENNMPVGIQLIGDKFREDTILNLAYKFSREYSKYRTTDWGVKL